MIKKLTIFAYENKTAELYAQQIKKLFGKHIEVECYAIEDGNIINIDSDLILASTHSVYEYVKKYVLNNNNIIIADITLKKASVDKLKELPFGTKAMLVNLTIEMAISTIGIIYNYGIDNIEFFPVYPGMTEIPKYNIAITPGESNLVPKWVSKVIDLGDRVLSMKTIVDIAVKLELTQDLHTKEVENYFDSIIKSDLGLNEFYDQVNVLEKKLDLVLQIFDDGIINLSGNGVINYINNAAKKILDIENIKVIGSKIFSIIPDFKDKYLENPVKDVVMSVKQQVIIISAYPIKYSEDINGCIILIKKISDVENEQYKIRKQIIAKGHVAKYNFDDIIGRSELIVNLKEVAKKMAQSNSAILIYGQSGTGKELFAQSIHNSSDRKEYPFIAINCASIPENLLESELFGYAEGAFTGAKKGGRAGYFELAHKGTLFLDEISEMNPNLQNRLLRALQEKEIVRIGGDTVIDVDVRIISASNKNLKDLIRENKFRQDLYYRLNVLMLNLPPLKERKEDIPLIIKSFKNELGVDFNITDEAMELIKNCKWEGNVREVRNFVERITYLNKTIISVEDAVSCLEDNGYIESNLVSDFSNDSDKIIFNSFIEKNKANLYKYYSILDVLKDTYRTDIKLGRRSISDCLLKNNIIISEQEVRTILRDLSMYEMVYVAKGRGGTSITNLGINSYLAIKQKYSKYI